MCSNVEIPASGVGKFLHLHAHGLCHLGKASSTTVNFPQNSWFGFMKSMKLRGDIGLLLLLDVVELGLKGGQVVTA